MPCRKKRLLPRHLQLAVRNDEELNRLLFDVTVREVSPKPDPVLAKSFILNARDLDDRRREGCCRTLNPRSYRRRTQRREKRTRARDRVGSRQQRG